MMASSWERREDPTTTAYAAGRTSEKEAVFSTKEEEMMMTMMAQASQQGRRGASLAAARREEAGAGPYVTLQKRRAEERAATLRLQAKLKVVDDLTTREQARNRRLRHAVDKVDAAIDRRTTERALASAELRKYASNPTMAAGLAAAATQLDRRIRSLEQGLKLKRDELRQHQSRSTVTAATEADCVLEEYKREARRLKRELKDRAANLEPTDLRHLAAQAWTQRQGPRDAGRVQAVVQDHNNAAKQEDSEDRRRQGPPL